MCIVSSLEKLRLIDFPLSVVKLMLKSFIVHQLTVFDLSNIHVYWGRSMACKSLRMFRLDFFYYGMCEHFRLAVTIYVIVRLFLE